MSKRRKTPEQDLQMTVAQFLRVALKPPTIWTAIGHGGGGRLRGAILKGMGVQPGWPDILVMTPLAPRVIGLELKSPVGRISREQYAVARSFEDCGARLHFCRSVEDVERALRGWDVPLHASVGGLRRAA